MPKTTHQRKLALAYITTPHQKIAIQLAHLAVKKKLAACANILPKMISVFEWKEKINQRAECVLLLKTQFRHQKKLMELLKNSHPDETPCLIFLPITSGSPSYLSWLNRTLR